MRGCLESWEQWCSCHSLARIDQTFPLLDIIEKFPLDQVEGEWKGYAAFRNSEIENPRSQRTGALEMCSAFITRRTGRVTMAANFASGYQNRLCSESWEMNSPKASWRVASRSIRLPLR